MTTWFHQMENVRVEDLPEHMDWRDKGVITPVMDQVQENKMQTKTQTNK